jgi:hypothetical protein
MGSDTQIPHLSKTGYILKQLTSKVGEVDRVDMKVVSFGTDEFHKAQVKLNVERTLVRVVSLSPKGSKSMYMHVMFQKIPKFCNCGLMGQVVLE